MALRQDLNPPPPRQCPCRGTWSQTDRRVTPGPLLPKPAPPHPLSQRLSSSRDELPLRSELSSPSLKAHITRDSSPLGISRLVTYVSFVLQYFNRTLLLCYSYDSADQKYYLYKPSLSYFHRYCASLSHIKRGTIEKYDEKTYWCKVLDVWVGFQTLSKHFL